MWRTTPTYPPSNTVMLTALKCNERDMLHATECMTWQETRRPTERSPARAQASGAGTTPLVGLATIATDPAELG